MFLIILNIAVPFTTLLEAFRTFHAKKWFLMAEVLSYPFKSRSHAAAQRVQFFVRDGFSEMSRQRADGS